MERGDLIAHRPVSALDDSGPIEFTIPGNPDQYIDLSRTRLYLKIRIIKQDGTRIGAQEKVAPVCNLVHSLFSQVDVKLKDTLVSSSFNTYPYKSYLEDLLTTGRDAARSHKTSALWYPDSGEFNETDPQANTENYGFLTRQEFTSGSKHVELMARPHVDLFQQPKYLIPGVDMSLKFIRAPPSFYLMADGNFKLEILDSKLYVRRVKINPALALAHTGAMEKGQIAQYPLRRGTVTTCTIAQGSLSFHKDTLISGQMPRRVIIGFVSNAAFNGGNKANPFNFRHFGLNFLSLSRGNQNFPSQPLTPDFANSIYLRAYDGLCSALGVSEEDRGFLINRQNYSSGFTLYAFDLTADQCEGAHSDPVTYGNLKIEVHFAAGLNRPVNLIAYCEFDSCIKIDFARNVTTDFQL